MTTDLSKFNNKWYNPGNKIKVILWYVIGAAVINSYLPIPAFFKILVLRLFGAKIGHGVMIKPKVNIKYPWFLEIGNYVWIGEQVWIDNLVKISIGDNTCISQGALLLTGNHNYKRSTFDLMPSEICLEAGTWIGAKSIVCGGVRCMSHSVLSVGSVATKDLNAYTIYQGNPAQEVRKRVIFD